MSKGGGSRGLGGPLQSLANLMVKEFLLVLGWNFLCCNLCPSLLLLNISGKILALSSLPTHYLVKESS